jgi:hypothetical protein
MAKKTMSALILFPDVTIPGISPSASTCILRVARTFDGVVEGSLRRRPYKCEDGLAAKQTRLISTALTWRITSALDCDEGGAIWPTTQLRAKGTTIAREDGFAHFVGRFTIVQPNPGGRDVPYFKGMLELIGRTGSHILLGERCNEQNHIEGWLVGRGLRSVRRSTLRAVIVAQGELTTGVIALSHTPTNKLVGTIARG